MTSNFPSRGLSAAILSCLVSSLSPPPAVAGTAEPPAPPAASERAVAPASAPRPGSELPAGSRAGYEALDWAFRFASALRTDEKDRSAAQESVVTEFLQLGMTDEALRRAGLIEGWRRGTALADVANAYAQAGRDDEARAALARAEEARSKVAGWQNPRIQAHAAQAQASLGDAESAKRISSELAINDLQYAGRSVATMAAADAAKGNFDAAFGTLAKLDANDDFDIAWWRTAGYLALGREEALTREQRRRSLDAARLSTAGIDGWKQAEALESVSAEYHRAGDTRAARAALDAAEAIILPQPDTMSVKPSLLANLARGWGRIGESKRARELVADAEKLVPGLMVTERAPAWAGLAAASWAIGDRTGSSRLFERAFGAVTDLENARPRALAAVSVCRAIGRLDRPLAPAERERLAGILSGLKDPW